MPPLVQELAFILLILRRCGCGETDNDYVTWADEYGIFLKQDRKILQRDNIPKKKNIYCKMFRFVEQHMHHHHHHHRHHRHHRRRRRRRRRGGEGRGGEEGGREGGGMEGGMEGGS